MLFLLIFFLSINSICFCESIINFTHPIQAISIAKKFLPNNPLVLEAGAYDGEDSINLSHNWPHGFIYSFEPVPQLFNKLLNNTNNIKNIKTYELALGDFIGLAKFYVSEFNDKPGIPGQSSSLLAPKEHLIHAPQVLFKNEIEVQVTTLDDWAKKNNIDHIDFMWLDMQGYELNMLKASTEILKTVKVILTEVEFVEAYKGQYLFKDVKEFLENQGFKMIAINNACSWFGDALFVRK
ncbi:FkbM family methyltransferase [Candidatus Dependentiae bacterium]|nr:FkbM family methyltransferase [Candidatus Dependentiae bacterium]